MLMLQNFLFVIDGGQNKLQLV